MATLTKVSKKDMTASQALNLYMNSGGTKATYEDVMVAVDWEKIDTLKAQYRVFKPLVSPIYKFCKFLDSIND